jgi:hypothetical protein
VRDDGIMNVRLRRVKPIFKAMIRHDQAHLAFRNWRGWRVRNQLAARCLASVQGLVKVNVSSICRIREAKANYLQLLEEG